MNSLNQKKTAEAACSAIARFSGVSLTKRGGLPLRGKLTLALPSRKEKSRQERVTRDTSISGSALSVLYSFYD